ncbi:MAG TPA: hypothetical protein PKN96_05000 [Flavobacterium sp.]|uniref:hypothetical protein n=1 Tax=Flavobacterium sp. TaxID=239 RepID=UPI002CEE855E|nr:hypothetical protein [Flavobacterium sp.]HNP32628.1 hypothetical protein [Flavobacterium sp.]
MKALFTLLFTLSFLGSNSQTLTPVATKLFRGSKTKLTVAEKNSIAQKSNLKLSKSNRWSSSDITISSASASTIDVNGDGIDEIMIGMSGTDYFGMTGEGFSLFMKDTKGAFKPLFEFQIGIPSLMDTKTNGFFDILIGGPGFEFPVYAWNGKEYFLNRTVKDDGTLISKNPEFKSTNTTADSPKPTPAKIDNVTLTPKAADFFKDIKSKLTNTQKNQVVEISGIGFLIGKKNMVPSPLPVDLNGDGIEELVIVTKTTFLGIKSYSYKLFATDASGEMKAAPGDLGSGLKAASATKGHYPDLVTGLPNLEHQVWRWNGVTYKMTQRIPANQQISNQLNPIESLSESYLKTF